MDRSSHDERTILKSAAQHSESSSTTFPPNRPQLNYGALAMTSREDLEDQPPLEEAVKPTLKHAGLRRGLSARQVQMIAIAGTIGASFRCTVYHIVAEARTCRHRSIPWNRPFIGPRRSCEHAHRLCDHWLHRVCHPTPAGGDGDTISSRGQVAGSLELC